MTNLRQQFKLTKQNLLPLSKFGFASCNQPSSIMVKQGLTASQNPFCILFKVNILCLIPHTKFFFVKLEAFFNAADQQK